MPTHLRRSYSPGTSSIACIPRLEYVSITASRTSRGWRSSLIFSTLFSFWFFLRNCTSSLPRDPVQAAFGLLHARPTAGPDVLVRLHRPGLRLASDALVALPEEGIYGDIMLSYVLHYLLVTPARKR